jgi:hypothetical protein
MAFVSACRKYVHFYFMSPACVVKLGHEKKTTVADDYRPSDSSSKPVVVSKGFQRENDLITSQSSSSVVASEALSTHSQPMQSAYTIEANSEADNLLRSNDA